MRAFAQGVQDCLGRFGGWNDGDDLHVATTLVALKDVDGEYAPEEFCPWQSALVCVVRIRRSGLLVQCRSVPAEGNNLRTVSMRGRKDAEVSREILVRWQD